MTLQWWSMALSGFVCGGRSEVGNEDYGHRPRGILTCKDVGPTNAFEESTEFVLPNLAARAGGTSKASEGCSLC